MQDISKWKRGLLAAGAAVALAAAIPPIMAHREKAACKGNDARFRVKNTPVRENGVLQNKTIIFLGSSVTYGVDGVSFVEYLEKQNGIIPIKEAVSGTTLIDKTLWGKESYITRMKKIDPSICADAFICQLSTNDATMKKPLGMVAEGCDLGSFDTQTVAGAIEYVIAYAKQTWNCPVIFYTGTKYKSEHYAKMIDLLYEIQKKWNIGIIDLWNDAALNMVDKESYALYMMNGIHPSLAGYRDWWTPVFERYLTDFFSVE